MGSSAASLVAALRAIVAFWALEFDRHTAYKLALAAERLQHGRPSGIDVAAALFGGFFRFEQGKIHPLPALSLPLSLVYTGRPEASTGECVAKAAAFGTGDIWDDFAAVTESLQQALLERNDDEIKRCIRENHRLLCAVGVTPEAVQRFIGEIEAQGGAAKISGAGSIRGNAAGMIVVFGVSPLETAEKYGFTVMNVQGEKHGVRLI